MLVKRKLYSVIDEEGNLGYYLYDENNGEEKLFSIVEEEREFARGVGEAVKVATQMARSKGQSVINKAAKRSELIRGYEQPSKGVVNALRRNSKDLTSNAVFGRNYPNINQVINKKGRFVNREAGLAQWNDRSIPNSLVKDHPGQIINSLYKQPTATLTEGKLAYTYYPKGSISKSVTVGQRRYDF